MSLLIAYRFYSSRRWFPFCDYGRFNGRMMSAPLIFDECDRDQNKYYDEHHALFVLREFENPEQTFHSVWLWHPLRCSINYIYDCHVERSAATKCEA